MPYSVCEEKGGALLATRVRLRVLWQLPLNMLSVDQRIPAALDPYKSGVVSSGTCWSLCGVMGCFVEGL